MHLRPATVADLPDIVAIYNSTIASRQVTADLDPVSVDDRREWFLAHDPKVYPLMVAYHADSEMLGWLSYSAFHARAAYRATAEISIYLAPQARGRGLGGELLQHAIDAAPALGFRTLIGLIFGHNLPSRKLFHRFGFVDYGNLPGIAELDGVARDLVIVGKKLA
jgi:L-amino acid N-acyltransferase YncA